MMNELEEILELLGNEQLLLIRATLFKLIARCLWNNDQLVNSGCLSKAHSPVLLPLIYLPLSEKSEKHWNATVEGLATNVLKMYQDYDIQAYNQVQDKSLQVANKNRADEDKVKANWDKLG